VLETDAYVAWLGAHRAADGGIVILGTGSCGLAVIEGQRIVVGGYGAEVSDEAGGLRMGRETLRRALWAFEGEFVELVAYSIVCGTQRIVLCLGQRRPLRRTGTSVLEYAWRRPAIIDREEAADAAVRIIERLVDAGSPAISLVGGLAEPLTPWLPSRIRDRLTAVQSDPLDGAILMARRAFFGHVRSPPRHHVHMQHLHESVRGGYNNPNCSTSLLRLPLPRWGVGGVYPRHTRHRHFPRRSAWRTARQPLLDLPRVWRRSEPLLL
jgi:hypothetical protein